MPVARAAPTIRSLSITRYRGIREFHWRPAAGVNVILGGGDVGKTTILEAIALLLSPSYPTNLADFDYHGRQIGAGFCVEAILSLPDTTAISQQGKVSWPWEWNGEDAVVPRVDDEGTHASQPVYRVRVRGTEDLELVYEIVQPDGSADAFPVALRRAIGLVRLGGDDRNDRDLRMVQGSALDRLLGDKSLRARMTNVLAETDDLKGSLAPEAETKLASLEAAFGNERLPTGLDLAITGGQGISIGSIVGLTARCGDVALPLASWGAGTRRLAALTISEVNQRDSPITLVDEIERGLEPYRQRLLMEKLQAGSSQVFVTTHSPAALAAAASASLWYADAQGGIGGLDARKVARHREKDPEAFLSRLTIVGEGDTEVGFVTALLEKALATSPERHGIHVSDGGGHDATIDLLEALDKSGIRFGCFADDEGKHGARWQRLHDKLGPTVFRWKAGTIEQNVIAAFADDQLAALIEGPQGQSGMRQRTLADRLEIPEKDFASLKAKAGAAFKALVIDAASGTVPVGKEADAKKYKGEATIWFKSVDGGRELCQKMFSLGAWPALRPNLLPFCNAIRKAVDLAEVPDLRP